MRKPKFDFDTCEECLFLGTEKINHHYYDFYRCSKFSEGTNYVVARGNSNYLIVSLKSYNDTTNYSSNNTKIYAELQAAIPAATEYFKKYVCFY